MHVKKRDACMLLQLVMTHASCARAQAFVSTFMRVMENSTVASAGLPTKLNSQGDVNMPMEASLACCMHCYCAFVSLCRLFLNVPLIPGLHCVLLAKM